MKVASTKYVPMSVVFGLAIEMEISLVAELKTEERKFRGKLALVKVKTGVPQLSESL